MRERYCDDLTPHPGVQVVATDDVTPEQLAVVIGEARMWVAAQMRELEAKAAAQATAAILEITAYESVK